MQQRTLYSTATLGDQATNTMTQYPTQSPYPDTVPTSPCHIPSMPSARLGRDKNEPNLLVIGLTRPRFKLPSFHYAIIVRRPGPVCMLVPSMSTLPLGGFPGGSLHLANWSTGVSADWTTSKWAPTYRNKQLIYSLVTLCL